MDRRKDGQTLFYRTLPTEAGGPKKHLHMLRFHNIVPKIKITWYMVAKLDEWTEEQKKQNIEVGPPSKKKSLVITALRIILSFVKQECCFES